LDTQDYVEHGIRQPGPVETIFVTISPEMPISLPSSLDGRFFLHTTVAIVTLVSLEPEKQ
jgi:hypothetical protein